jgi:Ser/Thr protein kinase RdoA (MazF antagonist)
MELHIVDLPVLGKTMVAGDSRTSLSVVERFVEQRWGLAVHAERVDTERDEQFLLRDQARGTFVLKVSNPFEDPRVVDMQTRALLHIAQVDPGLPVPRLVCSAEGEVTVMAPWSSAGPVTVRLLTYLGGKPLSAAPRTLTQTQRLGALLARLGLALKGFQHVADRRDLAWDLAHTARLQSLLDAVPDSELRALARRHLRVFEEETLSILVSMRSQVVHNDFNPHNILVDTQDAERITGVFDFGDVVRTQLVNDVAIGAAYLTAVGSDPLQFPMSFVSGYQSVTPLQRAELRLLPSLMAARLTMAVAISEWRAQKFPANRAYITKNTAAAWNGLKLLDSLQRVESQRKFEGLYTA